MFVERQSQIAFLSPLYICSPFEKRGEALPLVLIGRKLIAVPGQQLHQFGMDEQHFF